MSSVVLSVYSVCKTVDHSLIKQLNRRFMWCCWFCDEVCFYRFSLQIKACTVTRHYLESYSTVLSCGAVFFVVQCGSIFLVCESKHAV